jgi:hypothetical protein
MRSQLLLRLSEHELDHFLENPRARKPLATDTYNSTKRMLPNSSRKDGKNLRYFGILGPIEE